MKTITEGAVLLEVAGAEVKIPAAKLAALWLDTLMRKPAEAPAPTAAAPRIGEVWPGQGGIYAGICAGEDGAPDHHLILAAEVPEQDRNWTDAKAWATSLVIDGHSDFTLPTKREQPILYGNLPDAFEKVWHWSSTQHAANSDSAWCQDFDYGFQTSTRKDGKLRARAVRRLAIQ